jgi:hypothetical protein
MQVLSLGLLKDIALAFATCSIKPFDHGQDGKGIEYDLQPYAQSRMEAQKNLVQLCLEN